MLSKAMITNAIKRVKSERLTNTEDAAKYILEDNKALKEEIKKEAKEIANKAVNNLEKELEKEEHIAEGSKKVEEIKEAKEEPVMSKLKIKKAEIEGEYGIYIKEGNKVIAGEEIFNSLKELEEYKKKEIEKFNLRMQEIEDVYNGEFR